MPIEQPEASGGMPSLDPVLRIVGDYAGIARKLEEDINQLKLLLEQTDDEDFPDQRIECGGPFGCAFHLSRSVVEINKCDSDDWDILPVGLSFLVDHGDRVRSASTDSAVVRISQFPCVRKEDDPIAPSPSYEIHLSPGWMNGNILHKGEPQIIVNIFPDLEQSGSDLIDFFISAGFEPFDWFLFMRHLEDVKNGEDDLDVAGSVFLLVPLIPSSLLKRFFDLLLNLVPRRFRRVITYIYKRLMDGKSSDEILDEIREGKHLDEAADALTSPGVMDEALRSETVTNFIDNVEPQRPGTSMSNEVKVLETGPGLKIDAEIYAVPLGAPLTDDQIWALEANVRAVITRTMETNIETGRYFSIINQLGRPRFRFLNRPELLEAKNALIAAIHDPRIPEEARQQMLDTLNATLQLPH